MDWTEYLKFQEKTPTRNDLIDGHTLNNGAGISSILSPQIVYSNPEYTVISETDETVFVQDQDGLPHVFTREEWQKMQGTGGGGLLALLGAAAAGLLLLG